MSRKVFIGVAWPYVNGDIHIGHLAGYLLPADIYARFNRYIGNDVLMVSGSDCFGTPVTLEADKRKKEPRKVVEEYHAKNVKLFREAGISFDLYTKTDNENHKKLVQDFFLKLLEKGCIFKSETVQYYSPNGEKFLPDRYVEGICPHCENEKTRSDQCDNCGRVLEVGDLKNPVSVLSGEPVRVKPSEHYFLDWAKFQGFLESYVGNSKSWRTWVLNETSGWLKRGLKPRAITRDLEWGVPIPNDKIPERMRLEKADRKTIYVWFENIIGYLSASIEWAEKNHKNWEVWWYDENSFHAYFMGKDNLVFHTLFWPGELHGFDEKLHLPDLPVINQFLNLEGKKFSKSRGVTLDSKYIIETYGLDVIRFYLCLIMPETADANFSWADFVSKNNDLLIGNFGNFVNRTLVLAKNIDFSKEHKLDQELVLEVEKNIHEARKYLETTSFKKYAEAILNLSDLGNKFLSKKEPWLIKDKGSTEFQEIIFNAIFVVAALVLVAKPLLPETVKDISNSLNIEITQWPEDSISVIKEAISSVKIKKNKPLFKKIEEEVVEKERSKIKSS